MVWPSSNYVSLRHCRLQDPLPTAQSSRFNLSSVQSSFDTAALCLIWSSFLILDRVCPTKMVRPKVQSVLVTQYTYLIQHTCGQFSCTLYKGIWCAHWNASAKMRCASSQHWIFSLLPWTHNCILSVWFDFSDIELAKYQCRLHGTMVLALAMLNSPKKSTSMVHRQAQIIQHVGSPPAIS